MNIGANNIRIASYNVLNLFDKIDDPNKKDEGTPAKSPESEAALAAVMEASGADVIALQEVENLEKLTEFRDSHGLADDYPHVVLVEGNDQRGIDVALLSKHPITNVVSHKDVKFPVKGEPEQGFLRDLLQADITIPDYGPVRFFANHFAAKIGGERSDRTREAEAKAAREIIKAQTKDFPGQRYVMLGDFNDGPDSPAVKVLTTKDNDGWAMIDSFQDQPKAVSYPTRAKTAKKWGYSKIDQILLSPALAKDQVGEEIHKHNKSELASDHWMVYADFAKKN